MERMGAKSERAAPAHPQALEGPASPAIQGPDASGLHDKLRLAFVLNVPVRPHRTSRHVSVRETERVKRDAADVSGKVELTKEEKKRRRQCRAEGCRNYIVHKGLCCRHGGGKKCSLEGCTTSAKHRGLCWKHGGSVECKKDGCSKKAKARGLCWAHGGGTQCHSAECVKVAVSNGFCWAHGGGKRCIFENCIKPAYERTHNFCVRHYEELHNADCCEV